MALAACESFVQERATELAGSHTLAKNGGAALGYQGHKAGRTTNTLFLADNQRLPLAVATPQAGNQHGVFKLERIFTELCKMLEAAELRLSCGKPTCGGVSRLLFRATVVQPTGKPMTTRRLTPNFTAVGWPLSISMLGSIALESCLSATKPVYKTG